MSDPRGGASAEAQLSAIYQELILDHYRRPRNRGPLDAADARSARTARRKNPLCGDEMTLAVAFGDDGRVAEARFTGQGCSISQASASMLTQAVRGKTRAEVEALLRRFKAMMHGDAAAAADESLGELRALSGVARFPTRIQCATLAWGALDEILKG
jgi:nitrogen fixation NifU-like protein